RYVYSSSTHFSLLSTSLTPVIFFFYAPAPTEIYTLSLHDAFRSPLGKRRVLAGRPQRHGQDDAVQGHHGSAAPVRRIGAAARGGDRKSTRLNSSHVKISYAVFCLKKKKQQKKNKTEEAK